MLLARFISIPPLLRLHLCTLGEYIYLLLFSTFLGKPATDRHEEASTNCLLPTFITARPQKTPKQLFAASPAHETSMSMTFPTGSMGYPRIFRRGFGELRNTMLKTTSSWKWRCYRDFRDTREISRGDFKELGYTGRVNVFYI